MENPVTGGWIYSAVIPLPLYAAHVSLSSYAMALQEQHEPALVLKKGLDAISRNACEGGKDLGSPKPPHKRPLRSAAVAPNNFIWHYS